MKTFFHQIDTLVELRHIFHGSAYEKVRTIASQENPWFTPSMIDRAAEAICNEMLSGAKLREWLSDYNKPADFAARRVGIIAAGNIPMVGFFDLLCAVISGHNVSFKPSSKDRILMEYIVGHLAQLVDNDIEIVEKLDRYDIDFLIATGSDATAHSVADNFRGIPSIIRHSRHSIARISGNETPQEISMLRNDIFLYFGLGCRNISHLIIPDNYDISTLAEQLYPFESEQFAAKVSYKRAVMTMRNEPFVDANGFIFKELNPNQTAPVGVVGYSRYSTSETLDFSKIQCTINIPNSLCNTTLGSTQIPSLTQYPDHIDTLEFLLP